MAELYDLKNDPEETKNLISSAQHAEQIVALQDELGWLMAATGLTPATDKMPLDKGIKAALPDQQIR